MILFIGKAFLYMSLSSSSCDVFRGCLWGMYFGNIPQSVVSFIQAWHCIWNKRHLVTLRYAKVPYHFIKRIREVESVYVRNRERKEYKELEKRVHKIRLGMVDNFKSSLQTIFRLNLVIFIDNTETLGPHILIFHAV